MIDSTLLVIRPINRITDPVITLNIFLIVTIIGWFQVLNENFQKIPLCVFEQTLLPKINKTRIGTNYFQNQIFSSDFQIFFILKHIYFEFSEITLLSYKKSLFWSFECEVPSVDFLSRKRFILLFDYQIINFRISSQPFCCRDYWVNKNFYFYRQISRKFGHQIFAVLNLTMALSIFGTFSSEFCQRVICFSYNVIKLRF